MSVSTRLYDNFAPHFRMYSLQKKQYLDAIDKLVIGNCGLKGGRVLDIGCGDGKRGYSISQKIKARKLTMVDNSKKMIELAEKYTSSECNVLNLDISAKKALLKLGDQKFDYILCLWSVLGHISTPRTRKQALKNMGQLLTKNGQIYIDVSNRYNLSYYGLQKILTNLARDIFQPSYKNGDFKYKIHIKKGKTIPASDHFFHPFEIEQLIKFLPLRINKKMFVDYKTGKKVPSFLNGNPFYIISLA